MSVVLSPYAQLQVNPPLGPNLGVALGMVRRELEARDRVMARLVLGEGAADHHGGLPAMALGRRVHFDPEASVVGLIDHGSPRGRSAASGSSRTLRSRAFVASACRRRLSAAPAPAR